MVDGNYVVSLLGCANLIELILLIGGFIAVCIASSSYVQIVNFYPQLIKYDVNEKNSAQSNLFYDIDVYTIKQVDQAILIIIFSLTVFSFLAHIIFSFRYRYSWHRLSIGVAFLCIIYAFALFGVSVVIACWEDKLRKRLSNTFLNNEILTTPNNSLKPQIGSAAAASTFGFAACLIYLAEALIRFRRLADKIQR